MASRSRFYVDTPRDPSKRHSMFVSHSELVQKQDLSSNSSSSTLPSAAGSVDRLTGLEEKKSPRFFTLKPKTSFSLKPFFTSSSSLVSLSPAKRRKGKVLERRDSYVQTDESRPELDEVGVQTLNASTVDVPVQTCLEAWEEGDSYGQRRLAYASTRTSPFWSRPYVGSSAFSNSLISKSVPNDPLASPRVVKYAVPGDSQKTAFNYPPAVSPLSVNSCQSVSPPPQSSSLTSTSVPVKYFSAKELNGNSVPLSVNTQRSTTDPSATSSVETYENVNSSKSDTNVKTGDENLCKSEKPVPKEITTLDNVPEVSKDSIHSTPQTIEHPFSVLKTDRTDSPSKRLKSVHFDLPSSEPVKETISLSKLRNVDKDFDALLKDLNVLTENDTGLEISIDTSSRGKCLSPTLLSPSLKSAFDVLKHDFLAPIPESSPVPENEENDSLEKSPDLTEDSEISIKTETATVSPVVAASRKPLIRSVSEYENQVSVEENKNDSVKPTSPSIFTSANSGSNADTGSLEGNVYDRVIKEENPAKTVPLPNLPSFFGTVLQPDISKSPEIVEYVNETNLKFTPDNQKQTDMPLETDFEHNRLSRSSSRSSVRSNSKTGFDAFHKPTGNFDSCENLDQLEEEIIRSLYSPDEGKLEESMMKNIELPPSETFQNSGTAATHMRRVILDQLLSGKSVEDIVPNYKMYQQTQPVVERSGKHKPAKKYTAVLTKMEIVSNGISPALNNSPETTPKSLLDDVKVPISVNSVDQTEYKIPHAKYISVTKMESPKKTSVFIFPEDDLSNTTSEKPAVEISTIGQQNLGAPILEVRRSSWTAQTATDSSSGSSPSSVNTVENSPFCKEKTPETRCDFSNCLKPSKIQNSAFLAKINTRSMSPCNVSHLPPVQNNSSTLSNNSTNKKNDGSPKPPEALGECDYASCLKPSQVQNSLFTAELSEITANKSTNSLRAGSPLTVRINSPLPTRSSSVDLPSTAPTEDNTTNNNQDNVSEPVKLKSEFLITLQISSKVAKNDETRSVTPQNTEVIEVTDNIPVDVISDQNLNKFTDSVSEQNVSDSVIPPPPPPPPPLSQLSKSIKTSKESIPDEVAADSVIQDQKLTLSNVQVSNEPRIATSKTSVMVELEQRFQTHNKNDSERRSSVDKVSDQCSSSLTEKEEISNVGRNENNINGSSVNSNGNHTQNGNIIILSEKREASPLSNGKSDTHVHHGTTTLTFSPNTVITDEPPPPGAVLLDKKVTVEGDKVHTDKFYAIPMKEVLKEKTSTTKFIPAPPKYEGIGPTEDGIPIGLRNSVKKENMHNWYKTMFKSLHKADLPNDSQEYIIGYTSEPESSKKDMVMRKKSSTLDSRLKYDINSNFNKQNCSPSAKSSIEIYNVRPRPIEDYEPGYSSVTDDNITISRRYLPALNTPKTSYEFKNGYESDTTITRKREQPDALTSDQQKVWYREVQKGGDIPHFGLGKSAPEKPKEPSIGPVPPPPLNYVQPSYQQAIRPVNLPADYSNQNGNGYCQQMNGAYEMQMRHAIHSEMQQRMSPSSNQLSPPNRTMVKSPSRSPELKIPGRALFDFKAESPKEIPLKKGDTILILRQLDKNWYEGEHKGVVGIFPISYVEIVPPEHASTPVKPRVEGLGKALFDFAAQTPIELTVRKGDTISLIRRVDANWFEGIFNNKKGIIPISYIQVLQEPPERSVGSPSPRSYISSPSSENKEKLQKANSISPSTYSSNSTSPLPVSNERRKPPTKKGSSLIEPVMYRAMYSYSPQNSDELELQEGDTVYVVEMCDDGWYVGTSVRSGVFGIFPGNYVEKVC